MAVSSGSCPQNSKQIWFLPLRYHLEPRFYLPSGLLNAERFLALPIFKICGRRAFKRQQVSTYHLLLKQLVEYQITFMSTVKRFLQHRIVSKKKSKVKIFLPRRLFYGRSMWKIFISRRARCHQSFQRTTGLQSPLPAISEHHKV